jgi:hypothetical protein
MQLHVPQPRARHFVELLDLHEHKPRGFRRSDCTLDAAEIHQIEISRMRAHHDAMFRGQLDGLDHRFEAAGMCAAGDVGRRNQRHQLGIVPDPLTQVAVEIDPFHHVLHRRRPVEMNSCRRIVARDELASEVQSENRTAIDDRGLMRVEKSNRVGSGIPPWNGLAPITQVSVPVLRATIPAPFPEPQ